ncbi:MAG: T9SS type A sorting domain-containing protein [Saprospiraceae bacterium]
MSSGVNLDKNRSVQLQCSGITGLIQTENDVSEPPGCSPNQNNFLKSINASKGEEFLLEITNYRSDSGFSFHWTGNAILAPELCFGESPSEELVRIIANPNPTKDRIQGTIISSKAGGAIIRLFNANGVIIDQKSTNLISGTNDLSLSVMNFSPGTYYLNLIKESLISKTIKIEIVR